MPLISHTTVGAGRPGKGTWLKVGVMYVQLPASNLAEELRCRRKFAHRRLRPDRRPYCILVRKKDYVNHSDANILRFYR